MIFGAVVILGPPKTAGLLRRIPTQDLYSMEYRMIFVERRPATNADYQFVYELMKKHLKEYFDEYAPEKWSEDKFKAGFNPGRITILEENGAPIGFYDVEAKNDALYVHNAHIGEENRGRGYELQRYLDEEAGKLGLNRLIGKVFTANKTGLTFITKTGWRICGQIIDEKSVWVERTLDAVCEEPHLG